MKVCSRCKQAKPRKEFYRHKNYQGGYRSECKQCTTERATLWKNNNPERYLEYQRNWRNEKAE